MDREKINKAAEEARRETAIQARSDWHYSLDGVSLNVSIDELVESAFTKGAEWVLSLGLSERLSEEEKEKIKGYLTSAMFVYASGSHASLEGLRDMFIDIFGADLFKEK